MIVYIGKKEEYSSFVFLKKACKLHCGMDICKNDIFLSEYGKPYFNDNKKPYFSISHSGEFIACAFCNHPIGLDIQRIKTMPNGLVSKYLLTNSNDKVERIIEWTKFESYGKQKGFGIPYDEDYSQGKFLITGEIRDYIVTVCNCDENDQQLKLIYI